MADSSNGRFANVAGALIPGTGARADGAGGAAMRIAELLAALFEEVICVGGAPSAGIAGRRAGDIEGPPGALRDLGSALTAATAERVLVVAADAADVTLERLLALVAWPEAEVVVSGEGMADPLSCALVRREPALQAVRAEWAAERNDVRRWLDRLSTAWVGPDALPDA
ncbi:MAG TPA: hypothetical protein VIY27_13945 [Myxococcota bacterium]